MILILKNIPEQHCKAPELLAEIHADDKLIHGVVSHGYGLTVDVKPEHMMEKVLLCNETGRLALSGPHAKMRPSKAQRYGSQKA